MARSIAGHDKGEVYIVLTEEKDGLILINGKNRVMDAPKKKRAKHVQLIKHFPVHIKEQAEELEKWTDEAAGKIIKLYEKSIKEDD